MAGQLHQLSVEIGALKAQIANLSEIIKETREESRDEHRKVHQIIDSLSEAVRTLAATVKVMEPLTDDYREKRAEARGAARFIKAAYVIGGGSVAVIGGKLFDWFSARPHP